MSCPRTTDGERHGIIVTVDESPEGKRAAEERARQTFRHVGDLMARELERRILEAFLTETDD